MKITEQTQYKKHGCNFSGNLAVIDYGASWRQHSDYGKIGSMSIYDVMNDAKKLLKTAPSYNR